MSGLERRITNPEKALWQEVLSRLVEDALYTPKTDVMPVTRARLRDDARTYLTRPSRDLAMVCDMAGMDMDAVIERVKVLIAETPKSEELLNDINKKAGAVSG